MQERKKYTIELTAEQAEKMQQIINLIDPVNDVKFEEVKEEIDEREEAIKYYECEIKSINGCREHCYECLYDVNMEKLQAFKIALKHIQGYKKFKEEWLDLLICDKPTSDFLKGYYKAIADVRKRVVEEFDISEESKK